MALLLTISKIGILPINKMQLRTLSATLGKRRVYIINGFNY